MTDADKTTTATEHVGCGRLDPDHPVRFIIHWTISEYWADAKCFEAAYYGPARRPHQPAVLGVIGPDDEPMFTVWFRWDGCANWNLQPNGMQIHTCSADDVQALAELMIYLRKRASEIIIAWDGDD